MSNMLKTATQYKKTPPDLQTIHIVLLQKDKSCKTLQPFLFSVIFLWDADWLFEQDEQLRLQNSWQ